jgi:hypothetical protein
LDGKLWTWQLTTVGISKHSKIRNNDCIASAALAEIVSNQRNDNDINGQNRFNKNSWEEKTEVGKKLNTRTLEDILVTYHSCFTGDEIELG